MKMKREEHVAKINKAKRELKTAGKYHKQDLLRFIRRAEKELQIYDKYQRG